jgi:hypothetical protein
LFLRQWALKTVLQNCMLFFECQVYDIHLAVIFNHISLIDYLYYVSIMLYLNSCNDVLRISDLHMKFLFLS